MTSFYGPGADQIGLSAITVKMKKKKIVFFKVPFSKVFYFLLISR